MLDLRLAVSDDPVADHPIKITCPPKAHKERTGGKLDKQNSLAVYADHLHCFGCGLHLELTDTTNGGTAFVHPLAFLLGVSNEDALEQVGKYDSESLDAYRERAAAQSRRDPLPDALATLYANLLWTRRRDRKNWFYARGLADPTISDFQLGHDGKRFVIPVFDQEGNLIALRFRRDDAIDDFGSKYQGMKGRNGLYLFPEDRIAADDRDYLWLVEGELDAVRLWQEGEPAVSATNGAGQAHKLPALIRERFPRVRHLLIATDQDEPGRAAAVQTAEVAEGLGFTATVLEWPDGKDITEALQLGYDIRDGLSDAFGGERGARRVG